jgi:hypothetical protein
VAAVSIKVDTVDISRLANALKAVGKKAPDAWRRAVNRAGDQAKTVMTRTLTAQTGLKRRVIVRAIRVRRANYGDPRYVMTTRGGDISLKFFGPREKGSGVVARPFGRSTAFPGAFTRGGAPGHRVPLKLGGHAFRRTGAGRVPIRVVDSGVIIPREMIQGATETAFYATVRKVLPERLAHELYRLLP